MFDCSQFPQIVEAWDGVRKFWGDTYSRYPGDRHRILGEIEGLPPRVDYLPRINVRNDDKHTIHSGAMWEVCEYLGIPYPRKEVEEFIQREVAKNFREMILLRDKYGPSWYNTVDKVYEEDISNLEDPLDEFIPYVMKADMEKLRLRAVWGILIVELKLARALLSGVRGETLEK